MPSFSATKAEHQSKDDLDGLRDEVMSLRDRLEKTEEKLRQYDQQFSYISSQLTNISRMFEASRSLPTMFPVMAPIPQSHHTNIRSFMGQPPQGVIPAQPAPNTQQPPAQGTRGPDNMMQSLSHIAGVKLQSPSVQSQKALLQPQLMPLNEPANIVTGSKRDAPEKEFTENQNSGDKEHAIQEPPASKAKIEV